MKIRDSTLLPLSFAGPGRRAWMPWFVLTLAILVSLAAGAYITHVTRLKDQMRFEHNAATIRDDIRRRLEICATLLRGTAALYVASEEVTLQQFRTFVTRLKLKEKYPGIQSIGFARRASAEELPLLINTIRSQGMHDFRVWPEPAGDGDEYLVMIYMEPLDDENRPGLGFNILHDPVRRAAFERARDMGAPAASGKVSLVPEIDQQYGAGFVIYVPIYQGGSVPETVTERREKLIGLLGSPYQAQDLLAGVLGRQYHPKISLQVFDGLEQTSEGLLYQSASVADESVPPLFQLNVTMDVEGQLWSLSFASLPGFETASDLALLTMVGGILMGLVLFWMTRGQVRARQFAERTATALHQSQEALRERESRLRRLVDANIIAIIISDSEGRIRDANDAFLSLLGYTRHDLLEGRLHLPDLTPPDQRALDAQALEEMKLTGRHTPFEKELYHQDGHRVPVLVGTADLGGPQSLAVAFLLDLTERKRAERELARYGRHLETLVEERTTQLEASYERLRLSERLASIGTLATGIAHEINNPANSILLSAQYALSLRDNPAAAEEVFSSLDDICKEAHRCGRIVKNVLRFARKEGSRRTLMDVNEVVRRGVGLAANYVGAGRFRTELQLDDDLPPILGDPTDIEQVVVNLLQNAAQHATQDVRVVVSTRATPEGVRITVSDDGPGIPQEHIRHIFDPFFSTRREKGGTGLGLSMVHGIIADHGGWIAVESRPGEGATFCIDLPAASREGADDGQDSDRGRRTNPTSHPIQSSQA